MSCHSCVLTTSLLVEVINTQDRDEMQCKTSLSTSVVISAFQASVMLHTRLCVQLNKSFHTLVSVKLSVLLSSLLYVIQYCCNSDNVLW